MTDRPERIPERYPLVQDPPFTLDGVRAFLFGVPCDPARLDALLRRTFDWAEPDVKVRRLGSTCLLVFTDVARASARDPQLGTFAYREAAWFVPILVERAGQLSLAMHVPFIYPDEGLAVAAGREVYGLPKKPGTLTIPPSADFWSGAAPLSLRALAARRFDGSAWSEQAVCSVESRPQAPAARLENELIGAIDGLLGGLPAGLSGLLRADLVQLKQVADVTPGGVPPRVLYRAVTRVRAPVDAISGVQLGDAAQVTLRTASLVSEPIADVLGLPAALTPSFAAELSMRFRFDAGEVWKEVPVQAPAPSRKTRVLVLGGGMSALATAHALTDTVERRARYDVRVLVQGHLLGGKGASTRNPAMGNRNEEHGLHVFFGFYHNALRMMRSVYSEANRAAPLHPATFDAAFLPKSSVVFDDGTARWRVNFPPRPSGWGRAVGVGAELQAFKDLVEAAIGPLDRLVLSALDGTIDPIARDVVVFAATLVAGVTADVILGGKSWDDLDAEDFREWMLRHRLPFSPDLSRTAIMQVPYDGVFAYEGGDTSNPRLGAGIAARGLIKLAAMYETAPYFAMSAGMGEVVFAPIYEVLAARGVQFEFFAKVKELHVDAGRATSVVYAHQATVAGGPFAYVPTTQLATPAGNIPTFRATPDLSQLVAPVPISGADPYSDAVTAEVAGDVTLAVDADFDWVVCTLPAPVTARVLRGHQNDPQLAAIARIPTVATLHLQTWFHAPTPTLGWDPLADVLGGFPQPLNSMHLRDAYLPTETWSGAATPQGLLYASGPFGAGWATDPTDPAARASTQAAAGLAALDWLSDEAWKALPHAQTGAPPTLDFSVLFAPAHPQAPLKDQYVRRNVDHSSRYVLARPGGLADRPTPVLASVRNLRLAGDWTKNGVDIPCIEATVVSALRAAESILGEDLDVLGV